MIRITILSVLLAVYVPFSFAQIDECFVSRPSDGIDLDGNLVSAKITPEWANYISTFSNEYSVLDSGELLPTMLAQGLWLAGIGGNGMTRASAITYDNDGPYSFVGPLNPDGSAFSECRTDFHRVWDIRREEVEFHIADFADNGVIDNPQDRILGWPGIGNNEFSSIYGFDLPSEGSLAPFKDIDSDGLYEPMHGEYPVG
ncbi:MAG: hypothetical protein AAF741_07850 [Bacteroidota bacterium]